MAALMDCAKDFQKDKYLKGLYNRFKEVYSNFFVAVSPVMPQASISSMVSCKLLHV